MFRTYADQGASGQSNQVDRVREREGFVEIVDAPDQTALPVAPGAEVVDMKVANREHRRSTVKFGANIRPEFHPTVKGSSKKWESRVTHRDVFMSEVGFDKRGMKPEPFFE